MEGMEQWVVLSPHFDDGVLSCGGRIAMQCASAVPVRVITLFGGAAGDEVPPFARVQHTMWGDPPDANLLRRAEDRAAYARLGCADVHHLDAPDAVYRLGPDGAALYGSEQAIFGPIHPYEAAYPEALAELTRALLPVDATVLAPLGVGNHVDHQLARAVGLALLKEGWRVGFYEELPYIERSGAVAHAVRELHDWQPEAFALSDGALGMKIEAMAYYRSQVPVLYGDERAMGQRIRTAAITTAGGTGLAERVWWPPMSHP